jgi:hypothetical protein
MAMTRLVSGALREVWSETAAQGPGSEVVTTGIRVSPQTLSCAFGILSVTPAAGTPMFTATPSAVNGFLVVTVTNIAAPGNTGTWQLDIWRVHSLQQASGAGIVTTGSIHVVGNASTPSVASWADTRYIFLDGDAGNDSHVGYIDAPAGTTFTTLQAAAVAVRTTHRLEELRPLDGAGRKVVALFKPRAGGACYDHFVVGDGLGRDDRHLLHDYALIVSRGSDLTNSLDDRVQLGMVPAVTGPLPNSYFAVASVTPGVNGTAVGLTDATLTGWQLSRYRMHFETVGGAVYASLKWGDLATIPDPTIATTWYIPGAVIPGDTARIEKPGVVLHDYYEAHDYASTEIGLEAAGLSVVGGVARLGPTTAGLTAMYSNFDVDAVGDTTTVSANIGNISASPTFNDETGTPRSLFGLGISGPSGTPLINDGSITLVFSSFVESGAGAAAVAARITARTLEITGCMIQSVVLSNGSNYTRLALTGFGDVQWTCAGNGQIEVVAGVPTWLRTITLIPRSPGAISTPANIAINLAASLWAPESTDAGFVLERGFYTTRFDMNSTQLGSGVSFIINDTDSIPITYESLGVTGFEIEGERKVVCIRSAQGYPDDELPCPRGKIARLYDIAPV